MATALREAQSAEEARELKVQRPRGRAAQSEQQTRQHREENKTAGKADEGVAVVMNVLDRQPLTSLA